MFAFLKKRKADNVLHDVLKLNAEEFIKHVIWWTETSQPAFLAMTVVAINECRNVLTVSQRVKKVKPESTLPQTLDELILFIASTCEKYENDEFSLRKPMWMYHACLVIRANQIAENNPAFVQDLAVIWERLVESSKYIPILLKENVIWDDLTKRYFSTYQNESGGIMCGLSFVPSVIKRHAVIVGVATKYNQTVYM